MPALLDGSPIPVGTRTGRVLCAANRPTLRLMAEGAPAPLPPISEGRDRHGAYLRFEVQRGDVSALDASKGSGAPMRSFITVEELGNVARFGARITQHFGLVVEPGPMVARNLFVVLAQENAYPEDGRSWRSPPVELGIVNVDQRDDFGRLVKDALGHPVHEERLCLTVHALDAAGGQIVSGRIVADQPLERGRFYREIAFAFYDGRGGEGRAELWINGRQQGGTLRVASGYPGFRSVYPAFGVYAHVGQVSPIAARFYGWRESGTV